MIESSDPLNENYWYPTLFTTKFRI